MFTRQAPLIYQSLLQGGLSAASASVFQNLVGQCRAPLVHRGPVEYDYTRPQMRLITPEAAKFQFPGIALEPPQAFPGKPQMPGIPPFNPPEFPPPPPPECPDCGVEPWFPPEPQWPPENPGGGDPPYNPPPPPTPPPPQGCKQIQAGAYLDNAGPCGVYLKTKNKGKHCTFGGDTINGVKFRGEDSGDIKIKIEDSDSETTFKVEANLEEFEFIHSVSVGDERITFEIWKGKVFKPEFKETKHIELTQCEQ